MESVKIHSELYSSTEPLPGFWSPPNLAAIQDLPYQHYDLGQLTHPLCVSVTSTGKVGKTTWKVVC